MLQSLETGIRILWAKLVKAPGSAWLRWGLAFAAFGLLMAMLFSFGCILMLTLPFIVVAIFNEIRARRGHGPLVGRRLDAAAERGDREACFTVGQLHNEGSHSHPRDRNLARQWLLRAAESGHVEAAFQVSNLMRWGLGGEKDVTASNGWLRKAAEAGHLGAMKELSRYLSTGDGMAMNGVEAEAWQARIAAMPTSTSAPIAAPNLLPANAFRTRFEEIREEGIGVVGSRVMLVIAFSLLGFATWNTFIRNVPIAMGAHSKTREVWGDFGQRMKARGDGVIPVVAIPDRIKIPALAYRLQGDNHALGDVKNALGKIVLLCVIHGKMPAFRESVAEWRDLNARNDLEAVLLYVPEGEDPGQLEAVYATFQIELHVPLATPENKAQLEALGDLSDTPVTFVLDREGRIRQRWIGFEPGLMKKAVDEAMAER